MSNGIAVIPSARRLIRSLRDMGYEFSTAVADLIDNSIEAKADTVNIDVQWHGADSYVVITDNGEGMSLDKLREAMRFGSESRTYEEEDLGRFGLGLKTASMSQCERLIVASRNSTERAVINAYCWDLAHIETTNRWEILREDPDGLPPEALSRLRIAPGTAVIWQRLDRLLGYKRHDGEMARKQLLAMCRDLEEHLAMVFHRFLSGQVRGKKLSIFLNENKVEPWDPFARDEPNTKELQPFQFQIGSGSSGSVHVQAFVLPPQSKFSSAFAFARAAGPKKWNRQQGFYIYRSDRLIQSGGWSGLRTIDEHTKLARVALRFSSKLDEEFKINVAKMRVQLPADLRDDIEKAIAPAVKLADAAYRRRGEDSSGETHPGGKPNGSGNGKVGPSSKRNGLNARGFDQAVQLLSKAASQTERPVIKTVADRVKLQGLFDA